MTPLNGLTRRVLTEIMQDTHAYAGGREPTRPTLVREQMPVWRRHLRSGRHLTRDVIERLAYRAGFTHRHFSPVAAAERLGRLLELLPGLEETFALLSDEQSRTAMVDVLKLRVLGPYHVSLAVTPDAFRHRQLECDERFRVREDTFVVSDPWFSPLSLYRIPLPGGGTIQMHAHSVDVVAVFMLGQYRYAQGQTEVSVKPGDVVFDVGGCWGDTALYFANLVGPQGKVYTFEFDPESLEILRANLELNPRLAERIEIVRLALWDQTGLELAITQAGRSTCLEHGMIKPPADSPRVRTVTLDDFVAQAGITRLDFVKIDVEGAEPAVLRGGRGTLTGLAPKLAVAAYHNEDDLVVLPAVLREYGLAPHLYLASYSPVEDETVLFAQATR